MGGGVRGAGTIIRGDGPNDTRDMHRTQVCSRHLTLSIVKPAPEASPVWELIRGTGFGRTNLRRTFTTRAGKEATQL